MDATLKEITNLVRGVNPETRKKGTEFHFAIVYQVNSEKYSILELLLGYENEPLSSERNRKNYLWRKVWRRKYFAARIQVSDWRFYGYCNQGKTNYYSREEYLIIIVLKTVILEILLRDKKVIKSFRMEAVMATGRCAMIAVDTVHTRIEIGREKN